MNPVADIIIALLIGALSLVSAILLLVGIVRVGGWIVMFSLFLGQLHRSIISCLSQQQTALRGFWGRIRSRKPQRRRIA